MEETIQNSFIAVDRRLAERLQSWSGRTSNIIGTNGNGQLMPSYLILYTPVYDASMEETMELYPLKIIVHWVVGGKPKVSPTKGVITDTGVPRNPQFCVCPFSPAYGGFNGMEIAGKTACQLVNLVIYNLGTRLKLPYFLGFLGGKRGPVKKRLLSTIEKPGPNPRKQPLTNFLDKSFEI